MSDRLLQWRGMKKLLLLLPLLTACAPVLMAKNPTSFQIGQSWKVTSQSKLKDLIPLTTTFSVLKSAVNKDGDWETSGRSSNGVVYALYLTDSATMLVVDTSPYLNGNKHLRVCAFNAEMPGSRYAGYAAHPTSDKLLSVNGDTFADTARARAKLLLDKAGDTPDLSEITTRALAEAIDPNDVSACTLELL